MKNESNKLFHYAKKNAKIIRLIYKIKGENKISIFHPYFIKNNKNNFIMIINNKVHPLSDKYQLNNSNQKINDYFVNNCRNQKNGLPFSGNYVIIFSE